MTLNLDIDVVRGLIGGWLHRHREAGLLARRISVEMARATLTAGHDVIVAQFLAQEEFISDLEGLAAETRSDFVEVALMISRSAMRARFADRDETSTHRDAHLLVNRLGGDAALEQMYDNFTRLVADRSTVRLVHADEAIADAYRELELAVTRPSPPDAT